VTLISLLLGVAGCRSSQTTVEPPGPPGGPVPRIAVFPVENLSGKPAPLDEIREGLAARLTANGVRVLEDAALETVFTRHRVRYTGGLDQRLAIALRAEAGVDGVLIPSLEVYDDGNPLRVALFARLVATGDAPAVRWIEGTGAAGDDAPGILGIGLVHDPRVLVERAVDSLAHSLVRHLSDAAGPETAAPPKKFRPKIVYRSDALDPGRPYSIAVVPFFNKTSRKYAGEIVALHMMRSLLAAENLAVVEPGLVREQLLRYRIIMSDGISLPDTDTILGAVNADLVLNGEVLDYQDPRGPLAPPTVDFSVLFIERKSRRVLYSSYSQNAGNDRVIFFDWGRVNTAHAMTASMTRAVADRMLAASPTPEGARQPRR
jgi:hypothetical protein